MKDGSNQRWEICGAISIVCVFFWLLAMWMVTP